MVRDSIIPSEPLSHETPLISREESLNGPTNDEDRLIDSAVLHTALLTMDRHIVTAATVSTSI